MEITANVRSDYSVEIGVKCPGRFTLYWPFRLDRDDNLFGYTIYDAKDARCGAYQQYQEKVNRVCRTNTGSMDFSYVVFADVTTLYSEIHGERVTFSRV